jgi:hypothetical protein
MSLIKLAYDIDIISDKLDNAGRKKEAARLDKIAEALEIMSGMQGIDPKAVELAKSMGITLTPDTAAQIVKKYFNSAAMNQPGQGEEVEAAMAPAKKLGLLAALLVNSFIGSVMAQDAPVTVNTPFGKQTYSAQDLKRLSKSDPKTFAIIMEKAQKQSQGRYERTMERGRGLGMTPSGEYGKATKDFEQLSDDFGNTAQLITFEDGTQELKGDILHGGVSYRKKLEQAGKIMKGMGPYVQEGGSSVSEGIPSRS